MTSTGDLTWDSFTVANAQTPVTTPGAPTITGITPGNGQLSVAFTAGSAGSSAITNYEYSTNGGGLFTAVSPAATTSPIVITGLTNGTTYQVQIRAVNGSGSGTATASSPGTPATIPSAPTITGITPSNGQLSVAFTTGATGGSALTNYEYSTNGGGLFTAVSPAATTSPIVITGLTNGTTYQVQIRAVNAMGSGTATASTAGTPATTPSAPTITGITPGNTQLSVAFTAGADGSSALTNYEFSTNGGGLFTAVSPAATTSPIVITGLTNGTTYQVQIRAVNAIGTGSATASTPGTPVTVPGAPTIGTATAGDTQASVTFTTPGSNGGAAITTYTATANPGGATGTCAGPAACTITVTGLTNGTAYTFTVTATNSAGTGSASVASNSVTPKSAQTITFANPGAQNFGTTPTLSASSTSGLTVTFSSSTTGVCTITSGGALTFVTAGTCTIDADQAG
ncbi:MAG: fibronectin type III domain-containing protein, partial [Rhodoferax sp.]